MIEFRRVVLHDHDAAILYVIQQATVVRFEFGSRRVGADSEQNGIEIAKGRARDIVRGQEVHD